MRRLNPVAVVGLVVGVGVLTGCSDTNTYETELTGPIKSPAEIARVLEASCGDVVLPVTDVPVLPNEPLSLEAARALDHAKLAAGGELEIFEFYDWVMADDADNRFVLLGTAADDRDVDVPYASALLVRASDGWRAERWGQCNIQVTAEGFGNATWALDFEPRDSLAEIAVLINERACASGEAPVGRDIVPVVFADADRITITVLVEPVRGDAECPGNPWHPVTIHLGEPLGDRALFDGSTIPASERTWPPSQEDL